MNHDISAGRCFANVSRTCKQLHAEVNDVYYSVTQVRLVVCGILIGKLQECDLSFLRYFENVVVRADASDRPSANYMLGFKAIFDQLSCATALRTLKFKYEAVQRAPLVYKRMCALAEQHAEEQENWAGLGGMSTAQRELQYMAIVLEVVEES
jgi:hypothetical protein